MPSKRTARPRRCRRCFRLHPRGLAPAPGRLRGWLIGLLTALALLPLQLDAEARWPRFRGPAGNGHSAATDLPVKWGPEDVAWRTPLEGRGHSSPIFWEDRIFLTSSTKIADRQVARFVICLDRTDGHVIWQRTASVGAAEKNHSMNTFASPTCATDGRHVVAFFGRGGIHCFDLKGNQLWSRRLGEFPALWGTAASPIIWKGLVIQNCDAQGESSLTALNLQTGKPVWKTSRGTLPRGGWSTPLVIATERRPELILNGEFGVRGYAPETGQEYWFCKGFNGRGTPSPIFGGGRLYVISSKPGDTFAVRPGGDGDVTASRMVWHTPRRSGRNLASPILEGDYLITVSMEGNAYCYDAPSGRELWKERLEGRYTASPLAARGYVYLLNEAGQTLVLKPGPKLDIIARNNLGAPDREIFRASLAPGAGQLYCRSDQALYCVGKTAGK